MQNNKYNSFTEWVTSDEYKNMQINYKNALEKYKTNSSDFFNSLSSDQQLMTFFHIVRLIHEGELIDQGSYRHVLYNVFGFNEEAYALGMECGYMDLHNSIYPLEYLESSIVLIMKYLGLEYSNKLKNDLLRIIKYGSINESVYPYTQLKLDL